MLVTLNEILPDAKKNHYAVGLFNTVDLEMAKGVIAAAEEADSPVIIGTAEVLRRSPASRSWRRCWCRWPSGRGCRWCCISTTV